MLETYEVAVDYVAARIERDTVSDPMLVRNTLGLWDKASSLYQHMLSRFGLCHADDTGGADAKINGRTYDPTSDVAWFKDHWARFNCDPATIFITHEDFK